MPTLFGKEIPEKGFRLSSEQGYQRMRYMVACWLQSGVFPFFYAVAATAARAGSNTKLEPMLKGKNKDKEGTWDAGVWMINSKYAQSYLKNGGVSNYQACPNHEGEKTANYIINTFSFEEQVQIGIIRNYKNCKTILAKEGAEMQRICGNDIMSTTICMAGAISHHTIRSCLSDGKTTDWAKAHTKNYYNKGAFGKELYDRLMKDGGEKSLPKVNMKKLCSTPLLKTPTGPGESTQPQQTTAPSTISSTTTSTTPSTPPPAEEPPPEPIDLGRNWEEHNLINAHTNILSYDGKVEEEKNHHTRIYAITQSTIVLNEMSMTIDIEDNEPNGSILFNQENNIQDSSSSVSSTPAAQPTQQSDSATADEQQPSDNKTAKASENAETDNTDPSPKNDEYADVIANYNSDKKGMELLQELYEQGLIKLDGYEDNITDPEVQRLKKEIDENEEQRFAPSNKVTQTFTDYSTAKDKADGYDRKYKDALDDIDFYTSVKPDAEKRAKAEKEAQAYKDKFDAYLPQVQKYEQEYTAAQQAYDQYKASGEWDRLSARYDELLKQLEVASDKAVCEHYGVPYE